MATSTLEPEVTTRFVTVADLIDQFGPILAARMRLNPAPGTATVEDVVAIHAREKRLFELVDGILVEKTVGYPESRLAYVLGIFLDRYLETHDLGLGLGADGMLRLSPKQVRIPELSFFLWKRFPGGKQPTEQVPYLHPDLAVEVLSPSNTKAEMDRKLRDYFESGTGLVWYMDPAERSVRVFTAVDQFVDVDESGILDGGDVLPGFRLAVRDWFAKAERQAP